MTDLRTAAQQALAWLERETPFTMEEALETEENLRVALRAALAEEALQRLTDVQQEIEAEIGCEHCNSPLYAAIKCRVCGRVTEPAQPQRKPLTEEEIYSLFRTVASPVMFARAIERAHGIGGQP